jgi:glycerophosphoryl diester phosphodiesterase
LADTTPDAVIAIGHRGAPLRARENTLRSIGIALDAGADWVEIDAKVTADGTVIVLHDDTFERLWGDPRSVRSTTMAELRLDLPRGVDGIPTLAEAIELVAARESLLLIDIADTTIAEHVSRHKAVLGHPTAVGFTGDPEGLAIIRTALPEAVIALSWEEPALPPDDLLARVRPDYLNQIADLVTPAFVAEAHGRGIAISTYTVDRAADIRRVIDLGVGAIISNHIELLRSVIDSGVIDSGIAGIDR